MLFQTLNILDGLSAIFQKKFWLRFFYSIKIVTKMHRKGAVTFTVVSWAKSRCFNKNARIFLCRFRNWFKLVTGCAD